MGANSNSKKDRKLASILTKKGKQFHNEYVAPGVQECSQCCTLSTECVKYFVSDDGKPLRMTPSDWKKMKPLQRLEANLQVQADFMSGHAGTVFTYSVID